MMRISIEGEIVMQTMQPGWPWEGEEPRRSPAMFAGNLPTDASPALTPDALLRALVWTRLAFHFQVIATMQIPPSDAAKQMLTPLTIRLRCCTMSSNMVMQEKCIHDTFKRCETLITAACSGMPCMHLKAAHKWYILDLSLITRAPSAKAIRRASCVS